ncbi:MAG: hypothetical protein ACRDOJ_10955 [Nocardioidaceae bacterium]
MSTPRTLAAAAGAGFYRYWHVPHPHAALGTRETRRADLSVIGPGALALLGAGVWVTGRIGTALLLDINLTAPVDSLPWGGRLLVFAGLLSVTVATLWWVSTAGLRSRVEQGVQVGHVVRIPDNPDEVWQPLHAAVTELGETLRDLPETPQLVDPAFEVLLTAASALEEDDDGAPPELHRRLRRRCLQMAQRLRGVARGEPTPPERGKAAA